MAQRNRRWCSQNGNVSAEGCCAYDKSRKKGSGADGLSTWIITKNRVAATDKHGSRREGKGRFEQRRRNNVFHESQSSS